MSQILLAADAPPSASIAPRNLFLGWLFLFVGLLLVVIQPRSGIDLKYNWANNVVLVSAGCYWATRMPTRLAFLAFALWLCAVGIASVSVIWASAQTDIAVIAGLLPYSDAFGYFSDAQRILVGEPISFFSSRRPMFAAWMAGLLALSGNDLRWALALMTTTVAISLALAASVLGRDRKFVMVSIFFAVVVWLYYRRFIGTILTEQLGLGLGLLAFGFLWRGASERSRIWIILGLFFLTLALNARAGAFFVLPALVLWIGAFFAPEGRRFSWKIIGFGAVAIVAAFSANRLLLGALGGSGSAAFSNFSYTLYGLVSGGDWTFVLQQHPELAKLQPDAQAQEVYRLALGKILAHPFSLILGAIRAWLFFLPTAFSFAGIKTLYSFDYMGSYILSLAALAGLRSIWLDRRKREIGMVIAALIGIVLSVPFVPPWDADSMRAYAATLPFIALIPAWGIGRTFGSGAAVSGFAQARRSSNLALCYLSCVAFFCFLLPLVIRGTQTAPAPPMRADCPASLIPATVKLIPGTYMRVVSGGAELDRELKFLIYRDPPAAIRRLAESIFGNTKPTGRLSTNAYGYAPDAVSFAQSLQDGQGLALAMLRQPDQGLRVATVLFAHGPDHIPAGETPVCVERQTGKVGEVRIP